MGSFNIYSTLFIIGAVAVCSTESLSPMLFSLQNFIGAEDHATTTKISTPWPPTPCQRCPGFVKSPEFWYGVLIALGSFTALGLVLTFINILYSRLQILARLQEYCRRKNWGRKFYFLFHDIMCCGFCVRKMGRGKMYEYEEI